MTEDGKWEKGDRVKINSPKEIIHKRTAVVDSYAPSGKYLYVQTQTGLVWVYESELTLVTKDA